MDRCYFPRSERGEDMEKERLSGCRKEGAVKEMNKKNCGKVINI